MLTSSRATLLAVISFVLAGCAGAPVNRTLSPAVAAAIQPLDVQLGIKQPELYATFERSNVAAGAAACGAVPGIGILLAAACGATMGAIDATVNAERAKVADGQVRPLKDAVVDVKVDQLFSDAFSKSLKGMPKIQLTGVNLTKTVDDKAYEASFRASTSAAVMFVNVDYHLSSDFSTVEMSAVGLMYPRSAAARTAAAKPPQLTEESKGKPLQINDAAFRVDIIYRGALPTVAQTAGVTAQHAANINEWKADNGRLLRAALEDGARQVAQLLADEMQRQPEVQRPSKGKADAGRGLMGELISSSNGAQLILAPNGALVYKTTVIPAARQAQATPGTAALN